MTFPELINIVRTVDRNFIMDEFKRRGYIYCNSDYRLRKVSIATLLRNVIAQTEEFADNEHKYKFKASMCGVIKGFENYDFICVQITNKKQPLNPNGKGNGVITEETLVFADFVDRDYLLQKLSANKTVPIHYSCNSCPYAQVTNNFWTMYCSYWRKIVYRTSGCTRED